MMRTLLPFAALLVLTACNNRAENNDATDMDSTATADSSSAQPPAATAPDTVFTAFGNEPFWALYGIRDEKLVFHRHYFKTRLLWYVLSGIVACILFVIVGQWLFLYFAIFDLAMLLILYPTKSFFKKELDDEEIIFIP